MTLFSTHWGTMISGVMTFMRARQGDVEDLEEGIVAVAGVSYDLSCTSRIGSRFGPRAIRTTSRLRPGATISINTGQRMYTPDVDKMRMIDVGDLNVYPVDWDKTEASLRDSMAQITRTGALPIILGGDHYITYPLVQGFGDAVAEAGGKSKKVGYIQFSSQLDLGDEDPVWGRVWRGATARRIIDTGAAETRNMVWVGTNGYVRSEQWALAQELGLNIFTLDDIHRDGVIAVAERAAELAGDGCDSIYLSVDFDVLDGGYSSMTGAPSFNGLRNVDLLRAIDVLRRAKIGALDVVGVNPTLDLVGIAGQNLANWLVTRFISDTVLAWA